MSTGNLIHWANGKPERASASLIASCTEHINHAKLNENLHIIHRNMFFFAKQTCINSLAAVRRTKTIFTTTHVSKTLISGCQCRPCMLTSELIVNVKRARLVVSDYNPRHYVIPELLSKLAKKSLSCSLRPLKLLLFSLLHACNKLKEIEEDWLYLKAMT